MEMLRDYIIAYELIKMCVCDVLEPGSPMLG